MKTNEHLKMIFVLIIIVVGLVTKKVPGMIFTFEGNPPHEAELIIEIFVDDGEASHVGLTNQRLDSNFSAWVDTDNMITAVEKCEFLYTWNHSGSFELPGFGGRTVDYSFNLTQIVNHESFETFTVDPQGLGFEPNPWWWHSTGEGSITLDGGFNTITQNVNRLGDITGYFVDDNYPNSLRMYLDSGHSGMHIAHNSYNYVVDGHDVRFEVNSEFNRYFYLSITGVPEPATLFLLGFGGLALRKR